MNYGLETGAVVGAVAGPNQNSKQDYASITITERKKSGGSFALTVTGTSLDDIVTRVYSLLPPNTSQVNTPDGSFPTVKRDD